MKHVSDSNGQKINSDRFIGRESSFSFCFGKIGGTIGKTCLIAVLAFYFTAAVYAPLFADSNLNIDESRMRDLSWWNSRIARYSQKHYGQNRSDLNPTCIVLHYTAMSEFPWNLVKSKDFSGEEPGLASHYVVDGKKIWRILPDNIRSRGCYAMNHVAINIEMCALDAGDLSGKKETMKTCALLVKDLMQKYNIPLSKVYSHQQVASMNKRIVPEVYDLVNGKPYSKIDPGEGNMKTIKKMIAGMKSNDDMGDFGEK
ncbi:MAG: N-acetylmuramoyl-L-alanine amidase [Firmicutes bacterium]|nr:N-acetylmuramoyl-L-alanine amidase [Bacillota bacterium]